MIDVLVLDVNETLTDMEPLRDGFEEVGLPRHGLDVWFAEILRDGFALTAVGEYVAFRDLAAGLLEERLVAAGIEPSDEKVTTVLSGFTRLPLHADVEPGLRRIHEAGIRIVTLTNGAAAMSENVFRNGGILPLLEHRLDVSVPRRWKPHPDAYRHAAEVCGVPVERMALAAVHPWDIDGAHRAGLQTAYVDRRRTPYPRTFSAPEILVPDFVELAEILQENAK
ncbi:haloacid dehalogenase type II [Kribbella shirazensis]|uniref:2-haloacid dehalogenase n=1 Tax=Kribbella shirazensis TaxID=1105143 RepID=A0A7X5V5I4_9ACTN|nr:haloacid dehalogenase type II [Kribbella shirazensis]NIK54957.1 2-haloacid dehalogenase [Kribbella shirazensis]